MRLGLSRNSQEKTAKTARKTNIGPYAGLYESTLTFSARTPLLPGEEIDFNYGIHFATSLDYAFTQEMIPLLVLEPTTLTLAGIGGLMLVLRLRRTRA